MFTKKTVNESFTPTLSHSPQKEQQFHQNKQLFVKIEKTRSKTIWSNAPQKHSKWHAQVVVCVFLNCTVKILVVVSSIFMYF